MNGWKLLIALIPIMLLMGACGQSPRNTTPVETATETSDADEAGREAAPEQPDETSDQVSLGEENQEAPDSSGDDQDGQEPAEDGESSARNAPEPQRPVGESGSTAGITDVETAIEFLKDELNVASDGDILIDEGDGKPQTDEKGTYYTLHLISQTLKDEGGTGEVGAFRIYEDGRYEMED
ncbi:hypothetical protein ANABIO32_06980 [Rossellomorea marisflavi]|uniref:hypothetical protein n=1 Tax=Rossellomorea marisflavi TaxID=189381 RepID=UPI0025CB26F1|nr:hypothetical protein [Rossellomorea marisflavi]GLI83010.1 hypothetical protein ANABIO32_06980 [Rossellomorea marisflavi]